MAKKISDRDKMARYYARRHFHTDPGTLVVYYLPKGAPPREIRLLKVNELIVQRDAVPLEPLDMGVDVGTGLKHKLLVVDVTPAQWEKNPQERAAFGGRLVAGWRR